MLVKWNLPGGGAVVWMTSPGAPGPVAWNVIEPSGCSWPTYVVLQLNATSVCSGLSLPAGLVAENVPVPSNSMTTVSGCVAADAAAAAAASVTTAASSAAHPPRLASALMVILVPSWLPIERENVTHVTERWKDRRGATCVTPRRLREERVLRSPARI